LKYTEYIGAHWVNKIAPRAHKGSQLTLKHRLFFLLPKQLKDLSRDKNVIKIMAFRLDIYPERVNIEIEGLKF